MGRKSTGQQTGLSNGNRKRLESVTRNPLCLGSTSQVSASSPNPVWVAAWRRLCRGQVLRSRQKLPPSPVGGTSANGELQHLSWLTFENAVAEPGLGNRRNRGNHPPATVAGLMWSGT